ncbi:MAG: glycosyl hydrolase-related protein, partial [Clostridia bacterium]
ICVRMYECTGASKIVKLTPNTNLKLEKCCETNLIEEYIRDVKIQNSSVCLSFSPFEIKTLIFE